MRIFLAGPTGVIGRRLIPLLTAQGHQLTTYSRHPPPAGMGIETGAGAVTRGRVVMVTGDVYDARRLREVVAAARPEVVINQLTDLRSRDFAANDRIRREGTRNLIDAALAAGVRRVISQSIAFAYEPGDTPAVETTPLDINAPDERRRETVRAVAALEQMTAEAPEWVVLRYGLLYGPDTWYTKGGLMEATPPTPGPDITSFLHVDDAALACVQAFNWPTGPVKVVDNDPAPAHTWTPTFTASLTTSPPAPPATPPKAPRTREAPRCPEAPRSAEIPRSPEPSRTPWARGASNTHARTNLSWTPTHPTWRTGFTS